VNEVDGNLVFEIECLKCREANHVSAKSYFLIKKDEHIESVEPIDNKTPAEMNVIFCSLQRCGISWIIRVLSQFHEAMFGEPIPYTKENAEISVVKATRTRFPLPEKWNCVYEADPKRLLERKYDRVIVIERDLEELKKVHELYFQEDFTWQQKETYMKKLERNWHMVYDRAFDDPRFIKIKLDDLNNYTKATFTKLMDFLNFPRNGRPPVIPVPTPNRNWEAYSSILGNTEQINNKLRNINKIYTDYIYAKPVHKLAKIKIEKEYDPNLQRVLVIGPKQLSGVHFSEKIYDAGVKQGYLTSYLSPSQIEDKNKQDYISKKKKYPISKTLQFIKFIPDLIIVDECEFWWKNDVSIPVFYRHREFKRPPTVYHPTVAFFENEEIISYYKTMFAPHWMSKVKHHRVLYPAVDSDLYKPESKEYKGTCHIGFRDVINNPYGYPELANIADMVLLQQQDFEVVQQKDINSYQGRITNERYRELLPKCEKLWIPISTRQFVSRRMLEAMACKTACIIQLEDQKHEDILRDMGYEPMEHYISIDDIVYLDQVDIVINKKETEEMIEKAYRQTLEHHTYWHRWDEILGVYNELELGQQRYDVIVPVYWINEYLEENIQSWFREIPIRNLYFGMNNPNVKIEFDHPQVKFLNQDNYNTLGMCLADLMKRVETPWFVYLHSDVLLTEGSFSKMEKQMKEEVGIIESERLHWNGEYYHEIPQYTYTNYHDSKRSYSGCQLFRTEVVKDIIEKIEDDYIYRNEDIIFQNACIEKGFKYVKDWALHIHQTINTQWTIPMNDTNLMQWKGIIKYTQPNEYNIQALKDSLGWCFRMLPENYDMTLTRAIMFCYQHNPNWADIVMEVFKQ